MSNKTENVDVAFEMITEAVDEFSGYILGIPEGDIYTRLSNEKVVSGETSASNTGEDTDVKDTEGLSEIRKVINKASKLIKARGKLVLEIAFNQKYEIKKILNEKGFYINSVIKDYADNDRCIISPKI